MVGLKPMVRYDASGGGSTKSGCWILDADCLLRFRFREGPFDFGR